ncbi:hypothetical protein WJX74_008444 [Apatococcus lobatus]|uniref:Uncharacterized protein n=1 Tax=Apatococcus lobatus TaxID=904363 RepID=A0AAW1R308_9CHLO
MKLLHPDVNLDQDTTAEAAAIVAAYKHILEVNGTEDWLDDVFEKPETEPSELFINPFACAINPLDWRELQALTADGSDPEAALLKAGVSFTSSAILWLTPAQLAIVEQDLADMELSMSFEITAYVLADRLGRARFNNGSSQKLEAAELQQSR